MIATRRCRRVLVIAGLVGVGLGPSVQAQPEDLESWIAVESQNFVLFTDAHPAHGVEIARNLELFRNAFARLAPGLELKAAVPTTLLAFRDGISYAPYKSIPDRGGARVLGQFLIHPHRNFLTFDASAQLADEFAVIYHEFVHYLVAHNFHNVPRWFHEGLAEYYSTFVVEDDRVYIGRPVERHLRWLRYDNEDRKERLLSHDFSLRAVLTGESGHHGQRAGGFYALSWALMHYLLSGGPEQIDQMADFLVRLRDDEDPDDAFEAAFRLRLDDLEEVLRTYAYRRTSSIPGLGNARQTGEPFRVATFDVSDLGSGTEATVSRLRPADTLFRLGDLELRFGRSESAENHFILALDHHPEHAEALTGLAWIRSRQSRFDEAEVFFRDALDIGSGDPLTYLRYGHHLLAKTRPEDPPSVLLNPLAGALSARPPQGLAAEEELDRREWRVRVDRLAGAARAAFDAAVDLDGDYAEARALFGYSHLFGEAAPKPGIAALQKARLQLPDREDLILVLLQLHLKQKDFPAARHLLEGDLRLHANEPAIFWAEEEVERAEFLHASSEALEAGEVEEALSLFDQAIAVTSDQDLRDHLAAQLSALQARFEAP